jgi:hypothetical protein
MAGSLACSTRTCVPDGWTCRFAGAAAGDRGPGRPGSRCWTPRGKRTCAAGSGAGHARRVRAGGARLPGVPGTTRDRRLGCGRWRQRPGVPGVPAGQVGGVVAVLGGVELPAVLEVHRGNLRAGLRPGLGAGCVPASWGSCGRRDREIGHGSGLPLAGTDADGCPLGASADDFGFLEEVVVQAAAGGGDFRGRLQGAVMHNQASTATVWKWGCGAGSPQPTTAFWPSSATRTNPAPHTVSRLCPWPRCSGPRLA